MLAALIATRHVIPPPPPKIFYSNQLVAATTTFKCISIMWSAANMVVGLPIQNQLILSLPGQTSILDQLNIPYYRILNYIASDANVINTPSASYLSDQIAAVISAVQNLQGILASMTTRSQLTISQGNIFIDPNDVARLQQQLAISLAVLKSLGTILN